MIRVHGKAIETTTEGFLTSAEDWSEAVAIHLSERDNLKLTHNHWEVIRFLRRYYQQYGISPNTRRLPKLLVQELGAGRPDINDLFPHGDPAKQAARYAGMPKPTGCV